MLTQPQLISIIKYFNIDIAAVYVKVKAKQGENKC